MTRLVMPPILSISLALILYCIYYLFFGMYCDALYAGTIFGYLSYDLIHYTIHRYNLNNRIFQFLKRYHFSHHFIDSKNGYGVSTPLWDYVFNTKAVLNAKDHH